MVEDNGYKVTKLIIEIAAMTLIFGPLLILSIWLSVVRKLAVRKGTGGIGVVNGYHMEKRWDGDFEKTVYCRDFVIALDNGEVFQWESSIDQITKPINGMVYKVYKHPRYGVFVDKKLYQEDVEHTENWKRAIEFVERNENK